MNKTGKMIKILRKSRGLSQETLGEILGVKKTTIQKYENGRIQNIKISTLRRFCEYFEVPAGLLIQPEWIKFFVEDVEEWDLIAGNTLKLSKEGRKKVKEYVEDLLLTEKYSFVIPTELDEETIIRIVSEYTTKNSATK